MEKTDEPVDGRLPLSFDKCKFKSHLKNHRIKSESEGFSCKSASLEVYKCQFCHFESDLKVAVCRHQSLVHGTKHCSNSEIKLRSYICDKCDFETYSLLVFARHVCNDSHTQPGICYECEKCVYKTKRKDNLTTHILWKHSNSHQIKWFHCEQCSYKTKGKGDLKRHILYKHSKPNDIKWFECEQCFYKAKSKAVLKRHYLFKHLEYSEIKWFECEQCSLKTKDKGSLKRHFESKHLKPSEIKWFKCSQCAFKTKWKNNLKAHVSTKHSKSNAIN